MSVELAGVSDPSWLDIKHRLYRHVNPTNSNSMDCVKNEGNQNGLKQILE
jgi:hypothetical protein